MRGFPLLSTLAVIVLLAIARAPLYRTIAVGDSIDRPDAAEDRVGSNQTAAAKEALAPVQVRIVGTAEMAKVRVEHLGKVIIEKEAGSSFEQTLPGLLVPPEGIEFWVEAKFVEQDRRVALSIEIETDTGELLRQTLWGERGVITDSATLLRR